MPPQMAMTSVVSTACVAAFQNAEAPSSMAAIARAISGMPMSTAIQKSRSILACSGSRSSSAGTSAVAPAPCRTWGRRRACR